MAFRFAFFINESGAGGDMKQADLTSHDIFVKKPPCDEHIQKLLHRPNQLACNIYRLLALYILLILH